LYFIHPELLLPNLSWCPKVSSELYFYALDKLLQNCQSIYMFIFYLSAYFFRITISGPCSPYQSEPSWYGGGCQSSRRFSAAKASSGWWCCTGLTHAPKAVPNVTNKFL